MQEQKTKLYLSNIIIYTGLSQPFHELSIATVNRPLNTVIRCSFSMYFSNTNSIESLQKNLTVVRNEIKSNI